jgi:transcriptional regulator with XRE-family HTH domain
MQRVHRKLPRPQVEALRNELDALIPQAYADLAELIKRMRLITRLSQTEYAKLCHVAPRVLADLESGQRNVRVATLEKLLAPFGYQIGVVRQVATLAGAGAAKAATRLK